VSSRTCQHLWLFSPVMGLYKILKFCTY
jgi:hypothetical protein